MSHVKCIIFDCDGVLVDSESLSNKVLCNMINSLGFTLPLEELEFHFSGRKLKECFTWIETQTSVPLPEDFENEYRRQTFEIFKKELKPIKGIKEFINSLSLSYCVASSGPLEKIILNLTITGLFNKFENKIFSSYEIKSWKPDPDIFIHASKQMGYAIDECIVIEDSLAGVKAAVSGGFTVYALSSQHTKEPLQKAGAITFDAIHELPSLLRLI